MKTTEKPKTKEDRCILRKKAKRFEQSRDNLKAKNREKSTTIKKLKDRLAELELSRNHWRKQNAKAERESQIKEIELNEVAQENSTLKVERDQLKQEMENFKKKYKNLMTW